MADESRERCSTLLVSQDISPKHNEIQLHTQPPPRKEQGTIGGEGLEKLEASCAAGGDVKWCSLFGKRGLGASQNKSYHRTQQFHSYVYTKEDGKHMFSYVYLDINTHSSTVNCQRVQTTQTSIS